jgi:GWxTD domain-containing protein
MKKRSYLKIAFYAFFAAKTQRARNLNGNFEIASRFLPFLFLACSIVACHTYAPQSVTRQNLADYYQADVSKMLVPKYEVYNITDSMTRLYFTVNSSDLLYSKQANEADYTAHLLLQYVVHPVNLARIVVDSGTVVLNDVGQVSSKVLLSSVDMDIYAPDHFYIELVMRDLNKNISSSAIVYFDHTGKNSPDNFLLTSPSVEAPLFRNHVEVGEQFSIRANDNSDNLTVRYFRNSTGPALPPYSFQKAPPAPAPDSTWYIKNDNTAAISFAKEGWYQVLNETKSGNGITISVFHEGFPEITTAEQLVYPLRYLTTKQEYAAMDTATNKKEAVDKFWLNACGSQERARLVIRDFYNRVGAANKLFSTEREGWKTDRGMIYLIFGPPSNVYKTANEETWMYGSDIGSGNITFIFDRSGTDIFSQEDFMLERNESMNVIWIQAVDSWRQGHVYNMR